MSAAKRKNLRAAEAVKKAVRMAKAGELEQLLRFLEKACRRLPEELALWKLWVQTCRELGDDYAAALVALECLESERHEQDAVQWLNSVLPGLSQRNEAILEAVDRVPGRIGLEYKALLLLVFRDLPGALHAYDELRARWGAQTRLSYDAFAQNLHKQDFYQAAESLFWKALESEPTSARLVRRMVESQLKLGELLYPEKVVEAGQLAEALYERCPESPDAWYAMGLVWRANARPEQAFPFLARFFETEPRHPFRSGFTYDLSYVEDLPEAEAFRLRVDWAECLTQDVAAEGPPPHEDWEPERHLRIGYVSPDFCKHPVGYFAKPVLPAHDLHNFDVFLYSQRDPVSGDDQVSKEFRNWVGASHWRWIKDLGAARLLRQVREDRIDILVDLSGHTAENRLDVFCNRGAPVQVSWLGYPATTGVPAMDYRFSDAIVEPEGEADTYSSESIWRLPNGFHAINFAADLPEVSPPPMLKNGYITFGSFNNVKKLSPKTIALWARVLREIPEARLLLKHLTMENFANRERFRSLFVKEGIDPSRIRFQGTTRRREDHFAHYAKLDVALDPLAYNGTTTTCEALYMGVPVLTRKGWNHASRVSASLLHRMGMDGWVAGDDDTFVRIAKAAAAKPEALAARRAGMRAAYAASPLSDGPGMARDLEAAYREMWRRKCAEKNADFLKT